MNELLAAGMSTLAALLDGSTGWAIVLLALTVRLALLPLTLNLARKMQSNQARIKALQPQADAIKARLAADPKAMFAAIAQLYKDNGAHMLERSSFMGMLVQMPVFAVMYKAISNAAPGSGGFLWMKNLASPDAALTAIVLILTAVAAYYAPSATADTAMLLMAVQVLITGFIVWQLSAGVGLYWAASAAVSVVQTFVLRHDQRRIAASPAQ